MNALELNYYLANNPKKHLIFDLDETVAHLLINWSGFRDKLFSLIKQYDPQLADSVPNVSGAAQELYNQAIVKHGYPYKQKLDQFCQEWELKHWHDLCPNQPLIDLIHQRHKQYLFHLWTSNNVLTAQRALKITKLSKIFTRSVYSETVLLNKPYPDGFKYISKYYSDPNSTYLLIGNSQHDHKAAKNAHIDFFLINMHN